MDALFETMMYAWYLYELACSVACVFQVFCSGGEHGIGTDNCS